MRSINNINLIIGQQITINYLNNITSFAVNLFEHFSIFYVECEWTLSKKNK